MPSNKNVYEQLMLFSEALQKNDWVDWTQFGWSEATLYRYMSELTQRYGYQCKRKGVKIHLVFKENQIHPQLKEIQPMTKFIVRTFFLLEVIGEKKEFSRRVLAKHVRGQVGKISDREIDKWCKRLLEEGYIEKRRQGRQIIYSRIENNRPSRKAWEEIANILEMNKEYLPNQEDIFKILHKFNVARLPQETPSATTIVKMITLIKEAIRMKMALVLQTKKGNQLKIVPLYLYYHIDSRQWDLKFVNNRAKVNAVHNLRIKEELIYIESQQRRMPQKKVDALYAVARNQDKRAFNKTYEKPIQVCILFEKTNYVLEKVKQKLANHGTLVEYNQSYSKFTGDIYGSGEFFKWVRGFGSSAVILQPIKERKKALESLEKILAYYKEV